MGVLDQFKRRIASPDVDNVLDLSLLDPLEREGIQKLAQYKIKKSLGRGASAEVKLVLHIPTNEYYALKCISKSNLPGFSGSKARGKVLREMTILSGVHHQNVVRVFDSFQDDKCFYLVLELATGGMLFDRVSNQGRYKESDAANIVYQLIDALAFLHEKDIVHRDLKPENMMFKSKASSAQIMIMDFGVADYCRGNEILHSPVVGTPRFSAPEVLHMRGHGKPSDIWSIGCIAYTILVGFNPFRTAADLTQMKECVQNGPQFPYRFWFEVSPTGMEFVKRCLTVNPDNRITARQAKLHPWFVKWVPAAREHARLAIDAIDAAKELVLNDSSSTLVDRPLSVSSPIMIPDDDESLHSTEISPVLDRQNSYERKLDSLAIGPAAAVVDR